MDTIRLDEATGGKPLSTLGMHMFVKLGLVQHFALPLQKLQRFFLEIEAGSWGMDMRVAWESSSLEQRPFVEVLDVRSKC